MPLVSFNQLRTTRCTKWWSGWSFAARAQQGGERFALWWSKCFSWLIGALYSRKPKSASADYLTFWFSGGGFKYVLFFPLWGWFQFWPIVIGLKPPTSNLFLNVSLYVFSVSYPPYGAQATGVFSGNYHVLQSQQMALDVCQQMKLILEQEEPMEAVHRILQLSEGLLAAKTFAAWLKK